MPKTALILIAIVVAVLMLFQLIGIGTPYWMIFKMAKTNFGVFQVCTYDICFNYIVFLGFFSIHYLGFAGFQIIGTILIIVAAIMGLIGALSKQRGEKGTIKAIAGVCFAAAFFIVGSVIWFAIVFYNDVNIFYTLFTSETVTLGYSFILSTLSGSLALILAIVSCVVAQNMPSQSAVTQAPIQQPMVFVTTNQNMAYPNQPGTGQPTQGVYPPISQPNQQPYESQQVGMVYNGTQQGIYNGQPGYFAPPGYSGQMSDPSANNQSQAVISAPVDQKPPLE